MNYLLDIITICISLAAIVLAGSTFYVNFRWSKKRETIIAYDRLQEQLAHLYDYYRDEIEDFEDDIDECEYKALTSTLASIETFALCTLNDTYDRKMVYELAGNYLGVTLRNNIEALLDLKKRKALGKEYYPHTRYLLDWFSKEIESC